MSIAMVGQFILSLSLLIVLHECGHFFPAKWFKTRVEKFYLFFDPWFEIFKKKIGETEYGIGWLPLGGYVKISGMVDESMDMEQMNQPPQPWEFRSKKAWQRLIIMIGGVTVNFVLGFLIFGWMLWHYGEDYIPASSAKFGIYADSLGQKIGLKDGDKVLKVGDIILDRHSPNVVKKELLFGDKKTVEIERNGKKEVLTVSDSMIKVMLTREGQQMPLYSLPVFFEVGSVPEKIPLPVKGGLLSGCKKTVEIESPAYLAKLQAGDRIIAVNADTVKNFNNFAGLMSRNRGKNIDLTYVRKDTVGFDTLKANVKLTDSGQLGFKAKEVDDYIDTLNYKYTLAEALPKGVKDGIEFLGFQMTAFGKMFKGEIKASENLGGFISIGKLFGLEWDWEQFWRMTATLSLILAFMNLLPIPGLDGGYVMFLFWEMITGKKVSDQFMEKAVQIGFLLLISLIIIVNSLDVFRLFSS